MAHGSLPAPAASIRTVPRWDDARQAPPTEDRCYEQRRLDKTGLPGRRSVVPTVAAARIIDLKPARRAPAYDAGEASPATLGAIPPSFHQWRAERETDSGSAAAIAVAASNGHPILDQAARDAVQGWRFNPATRAGVPIQFLLFD